MDIDFSDYELSEMLDELVTAGVIDDKSAAFGVARQCLDRGYDTLTPAQRAVYDSVVAPRMAQLAERRAVATRLRSMPD